MVSIHAPTRGATDEIKAQLDGQIVSIHAPTRGATEVQRIFATTFIRFNPRPHAGGDWFYIQFTLWRVTFQSTPPRGGRLRIQKIAEY